MPIILKKIKAVLKDTVTLAKHFGITYACLYFAEHTISKKSVGCIRRNYVKEFVSREFSKVVDGTVFQYYTADEPTNRIIWVYWGQGFDNAPELVEICVNSIIRHAGDAKVILLTNVNYLNYFQFPKEIEDKRKNGIITPTHFSDLLRCALLSKYEGLWLDATVLLVEDIKSDIWNSRFWTVKQPFDDSISSVSYYRWNTAVMKGDKKLFEIMYNLWVAYWIENDCIIDYFLLDYFLDLIYERCLDIRIIIDNVPVNNQKEFELANKMNQHFDLQTFKAIMKDTYIFKLQRRDNYVFDNGVHLTYYGYLAKEYLRKDREENNR